MYYSSLQKQSETNKLSIGDKKNWAIIIEKYSASCSTPFTVKDVQFIINKETWVDYSKAILRKTMKSEWN